MKRTFALAISFQKVYKAAYGDMDYSKIIETVKPSIPLILIVNGQGQIASTGSGFVFADGNQVVTCFHVVDKPVDHTIKLIFPDNRDVTIDATVFLTDPAHDLAILKFEGAPRPTIPRSAIAKVKEGIEVLFSGYPLSMFDLTTHQGIISAVIKDASGVVSYMIDGTVNPGNSGCPLLTKKGEVIGVINATRREGVGLLAKVKEMPSGTLSLHGIDIVDLNKALIRNLQLGMGYAVPLGYLPTPGAVVH